MRREPRSGNAYWIEQAELPGPFLTAGSSFWRTVRIGAPRVSTRLTGAILWTGEEVTNPQAAFGDHAIFVACGDVDVLNEVCAYDTLTGARLWRAHTPIYSFPTPHYFSGEIVFVDMHPAFTRLDAESGRVLGHYEVPADLALVGGSAHFNDTLFLTYGNHSGLHALAIDFNDIAGRWVAPETATLIAAAILVPIAVALAFVAPRWTRWRRNR